MSAATSSSVRPAPGDLVGENAACGLRQPRASLPQQGQLFRILDAPEPFDEIERPVDDRPTPGRGVQGPLEHARVVHRQDPALEHEVCRHRRGRTAPAIQADGLVSAVGTGVSTSLPTSSDCTPAAAS